MFPEYVDKYNLQQQQIAENVDSERASLEMRRDQSPKPLSENGLDAPGEDTKIAGELKDVRKNKKKSFPTWMMLLLFSIFGVVMALPLLQL